MKMSSWYYRSPENGHAVRGHNGKSVNMVLVTQGRRAMTSRSWGRPLQRSGLALWAGLSEASGRELLANQGGTTGIRP